MFAFESAKPPVSRAPFSSTALTPFRAAPSLLKFHIFLRAIFKYATRNREVTQTPFGSKFFHYLRGHVGGATFELAVKCAKSGRTLFSNFLSRLSFPKRQKVECLRVVMCCWHFCHIADAATATISGRKVAIQIRRFCVVFFFFFDLIKKRNLPRFDELLTFKLRAGVCVYWRRNRRRLP